MGKVGRELTTEQGAEAAKAVMLNILATLKCELARTRDRRGTSRAPPNASCPVLHLQPSWAPSTRSNAL